jgi:two-component system alkaline phosphatase synthesis response regulator PhoP
MKLKVLVAAHQAPVLAEAAFSLKAEGFEVISATNGLQALKQACASLPDLIILDAMLPDIDGLAVCEILQRLPSTASIPILLLTASPGDVAGMVEAEGGANGYATRPVTANELVLRANEILLRRDGAQLEEGDPESAPILHPL